MWLKSVSRNQLFVALLLFYYNVMPTSATNVVQLKNPQHTLGQTSAASSTQQHQHQHQHHRNHVATQAHHEIQQQILQVAGIAAHPVNGINSGGGANSVLHDSNAGHHNTEEAQALESTSSTLANLPSPQYVGHEKEMAIKEILKHFNRESGLSDPYQILKELKLETNEDSKTHLLPTPASLVALHSNSMAYPWNLFDRPYTTPITLPPPPMPELFTHNYNAFEKSFPTPFPITARFLPVMSYPQPVYVPYPFIMSPDMFYSAYSTYSNLPQMMANDYEESMSRGAAASRRPGSSQHHPTTFPRNSPIYYMRLPPTPYMFLPELGLGSPRSTHMSGYPNVLPYQALPSFSSLSSTFNVPINFLANGKPTNIYQMSAPPNDVQTAFQFANIPSSLSSRPPPPPPPPHAYRPTASSHNYFSGQPSSPTSLSPNYALYSGSSTGQLATPVTSSLPHQDSKLTSLKPPYFFNGRPEDIYILPNNFNNLFPSENNYY